MILQSGERLQADAYVSALQFDLLLKLLPPEVKNGVPYWENLSKIELSPIAGVQIWFDREIDCPPALALLDRKTEWIFNKTKNFVGGRSQGGDSGSHNLTDGAKKRSAPGYIEGHNARTHFLVPSPLEACGERSRTGEG